MTDAQVNVRFVKSLSHRALVLGMTRKYNLVSSGITPKPSFLGAQNEDSC